MSELSPEDIQRICAEARKIIDRPCRAQGNSEVAVDCIHVPALAYRNAGFEEVDPGIPNYSARDMPRLMRMLHQWMRKLDLSERPRPADVAVFEIGGFAHMALLVDGPLGSLNAVHASGLGRVVETRFDPARAKLRGYYRWRL